MCGLTVCMTSLGIYVDEILQYFLFNERDAHIEILKAERLKTTGYHNYIFIIRTRYNFLHYFGREYFENTGDLYIYVQLRIICHMVNLAPWLIRTICATALAPPPPTIVNTVEPD